MMVRFSCVCDVEECVQDELPWEFDIRTSNGAVNFHRKITSAALMSIRHASNRMCDHDWAMLVYRICFHTLKVDQRKTYELNCHWVGDGDDRLLKMEIQLVSGPVGSQLKQRLGEFTLESDRGSDQDDYDLFAWTRELSDARDGLWSEQDMLRLENRKLKCQLDEYLSRESEQVDKLVLKEEHQMRVYTKLINDMKAQYIRVLNGEVVDHDDLINADKIRHINEQVKLEESPRKKKVKKVLLKTNTREGKHKKEEELTPEIPPDVTIKDEYPKDADSNEAQKSNAEEATSMASVHFRFAKDDDVVKEESDELPDDAAEDQDDEIQDTEATEEDTDEDTQNDTDYNGEE